MIGNVSHSAIQFDSVNFGSVSHHRKGKMPSYNGRFGLDVLASVPQIAMPSMPSDSTPSAAALKLQMVASEFNLTLLVTNSVFGDFIQVNAPVKHISPDDSSPLSSSGPSSPGLYGDIGRRCAKSSVAPASHRSGPGTKSRGRHRSRRRPGSQGGSHDGAHPTAATPQFH